MTWLYIPETALACVPAWEDSTCPFNSLAPDTEVSLTWRSKQAPPQVWSRRWKAGGFIRLLSGLTLPPSTADLGAASWISSLAAIRANQTALPESEAEPTTADSLSTKFSASSMKCGLFVSSVKTCRGTRTDSLLHSSQHWSEWATALRQEFSARAKPAIATGESDCSSWPSCRVQAGGYTRDRGDPEKERSTLSGLAESWTTPSCGDGERGGTITEAMSGTSLAQQVNSEQWLTPNVPNGGRTTNHATITGKTAMHNGKKVQVGLESQVETWATPTTRMHRTAETQTERLQRGNKGGLDLQSQTETWPTPLVADDGHKVTIASHQHSLIKAAHDFHQSSSPDQATPDGPTSCESDQTLPQQSPKRRLNPLFVEALMRWPTGLSGFDTAAMALIPWLVPTRTYVWMLFTARQEATETAGNGQLGLFE